MIAITDSGPMIALAKLNQLRLLPAMYDTVMVPRAVYDEVITIGLRRGYLDASIADAFLNGNPPPSMPESERHEIDLRQQRLDVSET